MHGAAAIAALLDQQFAPPRSSCSQAAAKHDLLAREKDLHVNSPFSSLHSVLGKQTNKSQGNPSALLAAEGS
jgi:hypothetical protein